MLKCSTSPRYKCLSPGKKTEDVVQGWNVLQWQTVEGDSFPMRWCGTAVPSRRLAGRLQPQAAILMSYWVIAWLQIGHVLYHASACHLPIIDNNMQIIQKNVARPNWGLYYGLDCLHAMVVQCLRCHCCTVYCQECCLPLTSSANSLSSYFPYQCWALVSLCCLDTS